MAIGIAIVGSGNFAKEQHLPAVQASTNLQLKAIYSRSLKSAQELASGATAVDLYSEDSGSGKSYTDLLTREDIGAVTIALPILVQPEFIKKALLAGKHVLSEKPIAKDIATAQELLQWYQTNIDTTKVFWAVGENFRYLTKFIFAAEQVRQLGPVRNFRINVHSLVKPDNKYYCKFAKGQGSKDDAFQYLHFCIGFGLTKTVTAWRKAPEYQGGFLLDGGVHQLAGLRLILGSADKVTTVSAQSQQQQPYLPPVDTVDAVVKTSSGATGIISMSWGSSFNDNIFEFSCEKGVVKLHFDGVEVNNHDHIVPFDGKGVVPEEALADLEMLEQMLQSAERDGEKMPLQWHNPRFAYAQITLVWVSHRSQPEVFEIDFVPTRQLSNARRDPATPTK
ncbi:hypothetical protein N7468_003893 [Penicillium chermesinum]|uniref:Oxidoreductase n=1 Tax=Penicillium chermesinum TaxID=63820 RepID=A0A9W9TTU1_9EURO|nr:uncharacterized protein N7468_003893 [Penicillium chermesinum]KAJ5239274.1 hypothetical protein N7468_003893 [Penicillium chermesinum]